MIEIHLQYFAILRDQRGISEETLSVEVQTVETLYLSLKNQYSFSLGLSALRVSVNETFVEWSTELKNGDQVVFIPPVAGG